MYNKQEYLLLYKLKEIGLASLLKESHSIIAGGAVRAVFAGEYISDYDIYFKSKENLSLFLSKINNEEFDFHLVFETDVAKTYQKNDLKLQAIIIPETILQNSKDIIDQFDYTICMGLFDFDTHEFLLNENFLEHVARRELYYNIYAKYPLASLFRMRKYIQKGYSISGSEIIKLGLSVNNLKMENYLDLKKQLQGIDTLFLKELTDTLLKPEYAEKRYDFQVFINLLDEYFNNRLDEIFE
jgi:hypothetical protein